MGLLDWLDGGLGQTLGTSSLNPQPTGTEGDGLPAPPNMSEPPPNPMMQGQPTGAGAMQPPQPPMPQGTDPMTAGGPPPFPDGGDPMTAGGPPPFPQGGDPMTAGGPPPQSPPMPAPKPGAAADGQPAMPPQPPGAPMSLAPPQPGMGMGGNGPSGTGGIMDSIRGFMGNAAPDQQGRGGLLKALGLNPDQANRMRASLGAGLSAAGNSAGKTGMQAFASGMGAALEGGTKEMHKNTEQAQGYLAKAIAAQKQRDDAAYNTNYLRYLIASNQAKYADGKNKNDSPTQLFLAAQRNLNDDQAVKAARVQLENATKNNVPQKELAALQANFQTIMTERQTYHLKDVGLTPEAAAEIKQQPGNTVQNPVKPDGLNEKNIGTILKPGQFYWSPSEKHLPPDQRTVYVYRGKKGEAASSSKADETPPSRTLPSNKRKPSDVPRPSDDGSED